MAQVVPLPRPTIVPAVEANPRLHPVPNQVRHHLTTLPPHSIQSTFSFSSSPFLTKIDYPSHMHNLQVIIRSHQTNPPILVFHNLKTQVGLGVAAAPSQPLHNPTAPVQKSTNCLQNYNLSFRPIILLLLPSPHLLLHLLLRGGSQLSIMLLLLSQ